MKSEFIYERIELWVANHDFKLKNVYVHDWEADHFSVTSSKYCYEIEVKVSRSDFLADFKKPKHTIFKAFKKGCGIIRGTEWTTGGYQATGISTFTINHRNCPNRFFYAVPVGLLEAHEIPEYAGLIYVMDSGSIRVVKKAPYLHKDQFNHRNMLFDKYFYQWRDQKFKIYELETEIQRLKNLKCASTLQS